MFFESSRKYSVHHYCSRRKDATSRSFMIIWGLFLGICNIVLCGYIEIVEQQACHDNEFRLTCPSLDDHLAILEAVFTPANATDLILPNNDTDSEQEGLTCSECFFQLSYPHTSAGKYNATKRIMAEDRNSEMNLRAPINHRCSGVNHCSFILNVDYEVSRSWGPGIVYMKYACMDGSRVTKYCNMEVEAGEGFIHSPGYPHYYVGDSICRWLLKAAPGQTVQLTVIDLSFRAIIYPYDKDCVDRLIIKDGTTGRTLLSSCEQVDKPIVFESEGESLDVYLRAKSKILFPKRGVLFHYKAIGCVTPRAPHGGYLAWRRGAEAHFMCCVGLSFPGGLRHRTLHCLRGNTWDKSLPLCIEKDIKIRDSNGTFIANHTRNAEVEFSSNMLVDVIIPSLLIAALFIGNAVIVFIIFQYRKRKEQDVDGEEFVTLTQDVTIKNGNATKDHEVNTTNAV